MTTAHQVARYMASRKHLGGKRVLHRLLYYVQAWSLARDGVPMFGDPIEAHDHGPVVRDVPDDDLTPDPDATLTAQQKADIDAVLDHYAELPEDGSGVSEDGDEPLRQALDDHAAGDDASKGGHP